jgi:hypothetical protein
LSYLNLDPKTRLCECTRLLFQVSHILTWLSPDDLSARSKDAGSCGLVIGSTLRRMMTSGRLTSAMLVAALSALSSLGPIEGRRHQRKGPKTAATAKLRKEKTMMTPAPDILALLAADAEPVEIPTLSSCAQRQPSKWHRPGGNFETVEVTHPGGLCMPAGTLLGCDEIETTCMIHTLPRGRDRDLGTARGGAAGGARGRLEGHHPRRGLPGGGGGGGDVAAGGRRARVHARAAQRCAPYM